MKLSHTSNLIAPLKVWEQRRNHTQKKLMTKKKPHNSGLKLMKLKKMQRIMKQCVLVLWEKFMIDTLFSKLTKREKILSYIIACRLVPLLDSWIYELVDSETCFFSWAPFLPMVCHVLFQCDSFVSIIIFYLLILKSEWINEWMWT